mgnify:CR=1 FL=1
MGDSVDSLSLLGNLDLIDDQHFSCMLTRIFAINLNRLKVPHTGTQALQTIHNKGFNVVQFRLKKPALASVSDIFEGYHKSNDSAFYSLSFVSINGHE